MKTALLPILFFASCMAPNSSSTEINTNSEAYTYLSGVSDAVMRLYGTPAIQKYAPEAMLILDKPTTIVDTSGNTITVPPDGIVSLQEFKDLFTNMTPEKVSWLTIVAIETARARTADKSHTGGHP